PPRPPAKQAAEPQPMARCAHCDVHMARADMVSGHLGLYCSAAHRQAHGDQATH
ncbi:MAG: PP0621 family protein, partial [Burkholderiaceae bacterium]